MPMHVENYIKKFRLKIEGENVWMEMGKAELLSELRHLKAIGLDRISSITGVDTGKNIEVIYHFIHNKKTLNIRISLDRKNPVVESITKIYPGANLFERELSEMLGVEVRNHPNPKKLFLSDESPHTPLRKT